MKKGKKQLKKAIALLLCTALLYTGTSFPAAAASFGDVPKDAWYASAVTYLSEKGILNGTAPNRFSPQQPLTRGAFAVMLAKAALTPQEFAQYEFQGPFTDVPQSHWSSRSVNWAAEAGVVSGYGDNTFHPDQPVTREEMAVMAVSFSKATGRQMNPVKNAAFFTDQASISPYAAAAVKKCQQAGILNGYPNGSFCPRGHANRAEAAMMYAGFLQSCRTGSYQVFRKRVRSIPVKGIEFDPTAYTANLAMGQDLATGGESPSSLVQRTQAKIGLNAAFFEMSNYLPWGTLIKEGRVVTVADQFAPAKPAFTLDGAGKYSIQGFSTLHTATLRQADGTEFRLSGISVNREPNDETDATRILFTRDWGRSLRFKAVDAITLDENGTVLSVDRDRDVPIPEKGYVLAQRARRAAKEEFFDACLPGDTVEIQKTYQGASTQDLTLSIGAGPLLVKNGAPYGDLSTYRAEGFKDPGIVSYNALRIAIGIKGNGRLMVVSANTTLQRLSKILADLGCTEAMNLDGGGSANLYVDGQWLVGPQKRMLNSFLYWR